MTTTRDKGQDCPNCGILLDAMTSTNGDFKPKAGDATICFNCGQVMILTKTLIRKIPSARQLTRLQSDTKGWAKIQYIVALVKEMHSNQIN